MKVGDVETVSFDEFRTWRVELADMHFSGEYVDVIIDWWDRQRIPLGETYKGGSGLPVQFNSYEVGIGRETGFDPPKAHLIFGENKNTCSVDCGTPPPQRKPYNLKLTYTKFYSSLGERRSESDGTVRYSVGTGPLPVVELSTKNSYALIRLPSTAAGDCKNAITSKVFFFINRNQREGLYFWDLSDPNRSPKFCMDLSSRYSSFKIRMGNNFYGGGMVTANLHGSVGEFGDPSMWDGGANKRVLTIGTEGGIGSPTNTILMPNEAIGHCRNAVTSRIYVAPPDAYYSPLDIPVFFLDHNDPNRSPKFCINPPTTINFEG